MRADPDDLFNDRFGERPPISAEAASESPRAPSYDELWRRRRFEAHVPPPPPRRGGPPLFGAIVAVLVGIMGLIGLREKIVRLAPIAARAYAAIGLPINVAGLELQGVRSRIVMEGARKVLSVEGEILNLRCRRSASPCAAPTVRTSIPGRRARRRPSWSAAKRSSSARGWPRRRRTAPRCWCASRRSKKRRGIGRRGSSSLQRRFFEPDTRLGRARGSSTATAAAVESFLSRRRSGDRPAGEAPNGALQAPTLSRRAFNFAISSSAFTCLVMSY